MIAARYAIFGGSFNPPHLAHTMACLWALETGEVDRVLMIPVGEHAFGKKATVSFAHRLEMCRIAVKNLGDGVEVSDIEGRREGTSYMVDTLEILTKKNPDSSFRLLVGSDVAHEVKLWKNAPRVLELAPLLEVPRLLEGDEVHMRPGCLPHISSTHVRETLRTGKPVDYLLSRSVFDYITMHRLYIPENPGAPR